MNVTDQTLPSNGVSPSASLGASSTTQSLAIAESVIESIIAQRGTTIDQAAAMQTMSAQITGGQTNPQANNPVSVGGKETFGAAPGAAAETATGIQYIEQEPNPEIPPEAEGYLQQVENAPNQAPVEIVIATDPAAPLPTKVPKQSVIVLPITPEIEKEAAWKSPHHSVVWLVEWSRKIMKMFQGKVVYRPTEKQL